MQSILCQAYPIHLGNGVLCYTHRFLHLGSVTLDTNLKDNDLLVWPDALSDIRFFTPKWQRRSDTDTQLKYPVRILTSKKTPSHHYISLFILLLAIHSWMLPPTHHVEVAEYRVEKGQFTVISRTGLY